MEPGWWLERIGDAWDILMKRLGYNKYVAQGGDWGAGVVEAMGRKAPVGLLGIHTNLRAVITPEVEKALGGTVGSLTSIPIASPNMRRVARFFRLHFDRPHSYE